MYRKLWNISQVAVGGKTIVLHVKKFSNDNGGKKISFVGPLTNHLIAIKQRHEKLGEELAGSQVLSVSEITRLGKEFNSISRLVELITERDVLLAAISELELLEQQEIKK